MISLSDKKSGQLPTNHSEFIACRITNLRFDNPALGAGLLALHFHGGSGTFKKCAINSDTYVASDLVNCAEGSWKRDSLSGSSHDAIASADC